jgi:putative heme iron utilization protein
MLVLLVTFISNFVNCYENKIQAASIARSILQSAQLGELGTIQANYKGHEVSGYPFVTTQFIAEDCSNSDGNPFFAIVTWGNHAKNIQANTKGSIFVRESSWYLPQPPADRGRLDHPRFTLFGTLSKIEADQYKHYDECFRFTHPDASDWMLHDFQYYKLVVEDVNFIGGYGDRHYVGWIDKELYSKAAMNISLRTQRGRK